MKDVVIVMMHAFMVILECIYSYHKGLLLGGKYYFFQLLPVGCLVEAYDLQQGTLGGL